MTDTNPSILDDPRWTALSDKRQAELLEEYRDRLDYAWWDSTYDDFKSKCKDLGIAVDDIEFSGFCSQGDGARFDGSVSDWELLLKHLKKDNLLAEAKRNNWDFLIRPSSSRYSHAYTMYGEFITSIEQNPHDGEDDPLRFDAWNLANPSLDEYEMQELESELTEFFRSLANQLYCDLEEEHDYLTDDEQTVDYILNNLSDEELADPDEKEDNDEEETDQINQIEIFS